MIEPQPIPTDPRFINLTGRRFTRLTVLQYAGFKTTPSRRTHYWLCACDCGAVKPIRGDALLNETTISCGCRRKESFKKTHGCRRVPEYGIWASILQRCNNPNVRSYKDYGGRGIRVCERWRKFENFLQDMGYRPSPKHSIGRKDNAKEYSPANCQWETRKEQQRNTRQNRLITYKGETLPLIEWTERVGLAYWLVHGRLSRGWSIEDALTKPVEHRKTRKTG